MKKKMKKKKDSFQQAVLNQILLAQSSYIVFLMIESLDYLAGTLLSDNENEKLLARQENLFVPGNWTVLFLNPACIPSS